ncbi:TlpA family protein disulfide reductase [Dyadobacter sp. CY261]|uniref:TlpA family protein disulfide reductase n=1 Tax=Dyadobacter sp. CY261 TaxID=2907203 RepID=UPI001F40B462|nr:TlpA disulfide reductase family protein [Dyadobacter sp. CY261]MCF0075004.1 TlpA family protein disulfide reductase [Dyadobacter sp. CY261]
MLALRRLICFNFLFLLVGGYSSAQKLDMKGSVIIRLSCNNLTADLPVSAEIFHSFPAYSYSQVVDTLSAKRNKLWMSCPVYTPQEGFITINDTKIHLFMVPADTIYLSILGSNEKVSYLIEGRSEAVQNYYRAKSAKFPISIGQQIMNAGVSEGKLSQFKVVADSLHALERDFFEEHSKMLPSWFVRFELDAIRYSNAWLRFYAYYYKQDVWQQREKAPEGYFSFLAGVPIRNAGAQNDYEYLNFLREYVRYKSDQIVAVKQPKSNNLPNYQKNVELLGKRIGEFFTIFLTSEALNVKPQDIDKQLASLPISEANVHLAIYLKEQASQRLNLLNVGKSSPKFLLVDSEDSLISLDQFKGKVVYLSFWFVGCKGCIKEFPFENELVDNFKDERVQIISICTRSPKEKWLEMINGYGLRTLNLYANSAWGRKLEEKFGVNVYPHYVLIGPDGTIAENFTSRPSSGAAAKINKMLPTANAY